MERIFPTYNPFLEIKKSLIEDADLGLFAKCFIPAKSLIDVYFGKMVTNSKLEQLEDRFPEKNFRMYDLFNEKKNLHILCLEDSDCYARYCNDISLQGKICNASFEYFRFEKPFTDFDSKFLNLLPPSQRKATMCIQALCDIQEGEEIYVPYGSSYWSQCIKKKYQRQKRRFKRIVSLVKKKIWSKYSYIKKKDSTRTLDTIEIPLWPQSNCESNCKSNGKSNCKEFVWAGWSRTTKKSRKNSLLDYDSKRKRWLILKKKSKPLPYPTTRYLFCQRIQL